MRSLLFAIFVLLIAASGWATEPAKWNLFPAEDGSFEILLPGTPTTTHKSRSTYMGDVIETRHETRRGPHEVTLIFQEIPKIAVTLVPDRVILAQAGDRLLEAAEGRASLDRSYTWNGFSARELSYEGPGEPPTLTRVRLILVDSRLYLVIASWAVPQEIPAPLVDFLDSFALTTPEDALAPVGAGTSGE